MPRILPDSQQRLSFERGWVRDKLHPLHGFRSRHWGGRLRETTRGVDCQGGGSYQGERKESWPLLDKGAWPGLPWPSSAAVSSHSGIQAMQSCWDKSQTGKVPSRGRETQGKPSDHHEALAVPLGLCRCQQLHRGSWSHHFQQAPISTDSPEQYFQPLMITLTHRGREKGREGRSTETLPHHSQGFILGSGSCPALLLTSCCSLCSRNFYL